MSNMTPAITSKNLITVEGLVVDTLTGEVHKLSVFSTPADYQPSLRDCRSVDDFERYLTFVDRRKLPAHTLHPLHDEVDYARGVWCRSGIDCRITLPQQRLLEALRQLVVYRNVIFITQASLAKALGTAESNLMKKLKVLEEVNLLRVTTSRHGNIRSGEIKLVINPRLVFRGSDSTREAYLKDWYRPVDGLSSRLEDANERGRCINLAA
ncbi:replication/maintenance protein RepL [Pseudomonas sp. Irchel s3b5]|uniref:replication/maintenance protein RepL n=1 Tax=Pseudomonas sp. Irchel s3b5 TaxID=2009077 RepID=UPI002114AF38|nr:replication/maintenance protein RepL [Pseudomonas sp. Irchel s3b5]